MSLTVHLASMPRRPKAKASAKPMPERVTAVDSNWATTAIMRVGKALIMLAGVVLIIGAITAFKVWMWWPQGHY